MIPFHGWVCLSTYFHFQSKDYLSIYLNSYLVSGKQGQHSKKIKYNFVTFNSGYIDMLEETWFAILLWLRAASHLHNKD